MRIGPNELVTNDPVLLRKMSAVRSPYRRSAWYGGTRLEPEYDATFSEMSEERHNMLRSKLAMGVSPLFLSPAFDYLLANKTQVFRERQ